MARALQIDDSVRYWRDFLQSTAMVTGPAAPTGVGPFGRGRVNAIDLVLPSGGLILAPVPCP